MTAEEPVPLSRDYTLDEVAEALGMSTRWIRNKISEGAEHQRYGNKIRFTAEQVAQLRASHTRAPVKKSVTTGKNRKRRQP